LLALTSRANDDMFRFTLSMLPFLVSLNSTIVQWLLFTAL
jgi:hypothetical protein